MARFDGTLARKLDFGEVTTTYGHAPRRPALRLATGPSGRGPEKYKELDHRRRQAQIKARRLLDLID
jgi:hypothetical protein